MAVWLALFVAAEHLAFLALECFLWRRPVGRRIFRLTPDQAEATAVLARNQGVYNGFLAAGLVWSVLAPAPLAQPLRLFFAVCVAVAGMVGAATVNRRIFFVQALPGILLAAFSLG